MSKWRRALRALVFQIRPRAERRSTFGLAAEYGLGSNFTSAKIKDISTSGIYLITEKRLRTNELITLILREESQAETNSELQFSVHARVARQGEDGIGLSFVLPLGLDTNLWGVIIRNIVTLTRADQIADMFRTLRVILFLCRICGSKAEEPVLLLGGHLTDERVNNLVKIGLAAEKLLASEPDFERRRAQSRLVTNILREGSWTSDELIIQLWAGLLASSCVLGEPDNSNQTFVNLLIHIAPGVARIFTYACEQADGFALGIEDSPSFSVVVAPEDLIGITGASHHFRNAMSIAYLSNLGLVQKLPDLTTYRLFEEFDITPTSLGLELYKHCHGSRTKVDGRLALTARKHLRDFLFQPTQTTPERFQDEVAVRTEVCELQQYS